MRLVIRGVLVALVFLAAASSGCLGGEKRSEWAYSSTGLDDLYDQGLRGTDIRIAILDTGINLKHPSLNHLKDGKTGNGEVIAFKNFLDGQEGVDSASDNHGHGSHVAGIISARGSDFGDKLVYGGIDLLGAAPNAQLIVATVCTEDSCDSAVIDEAIRWSMAQGAQVISLSLGGGALVDLVSRLQNAESAAIQQSIGDAVDDAINRGIVVVAAAGNEGSDAPDVAFPASIPEVIAVGAVTKQNQPADFTQHGSNNGCQGGIFSTGRCKPDQKPELMAPGVEVLSAWNGDWYVRASGTSQATPFVSAAAALLIEAKGPLRSASDVGVLKRVLVDSAKPLEGQATPHDDLSGYGLLQAAAARAAYAP